SGNDRKEVMRAYVTSHTPPSREFEYEVSRNRPSRRTLARISAPLPVLGRTHLEAQHDVAQLHAVAVVQFAELRYGNFVYPRPLGRRAIVEEQVAPAVALDDGVLLLHLHVAE